MKIHVEFQSVAEMVNFGRFVGTDLVSPITMTKAQRQDASFKEAYEKTLANLERAYERIREFEDMKKNNQVIKAEVEKMTKKKEAKITELNLTVRAKNALKNQNIKYISELIQKTPNDLMKIENFGKGSLQSVLSALKERNLSLMETR